MDLGPDGMRVVTIRPLSVDEVLDFAVSETDKEISGAARVMAARVMNVRTAVRVALQTDARRVGRHVHLNPSAVPQEMPPPRKRWADRDILRTCLPGPTSGRGSRWSVADATGGCTEFVSCMPMSWM